MLTTPLARAFGITAATPDVEAAAAAAATRHMAIASYMPSYSNRLHDHVYPGGGTAFCCDLRRRNSWISNRGSRSACGRGDGGGALIVLCQQVLLIDGAQELDGSAPLLSAAEVAIAREFAIGAPCAALCAHALVSPGSWVRVHTLPSPAAASAALGAEAGAWDAAIADGAARGLLGSLNASSPPPLAELLVPLSTLPVRALRELHSQCGLGAPRASPALAGAAAGAGGGGSGAEAAPSISASLGLAQQLVTALGRRRSPPLQPLLQALGPCVQLPLPVAASLHRLSVLGFVACGYRPEEASAMLSGGAGVDAASRFASAAEVAAACTGAPPDGSTAVAATAAAAASAASPAGSAASPAAASPASSSSIASSASSASSASISTPAMPTTTRLACRVGSRRELDVLVGSLTLADRAEAALGTPSACPPEDAAVLLGRCALPAGTRPPLRAVEGR